MTVTKLIYTCYYIAIQRQRDSGHYSQHRCPQPGGRGRWLLPNTLHSCIVNPPISTLYQHRCAHTCTHTCTPIASFFSHPAKKKKDPGLQLTRPRLLVTSGAPGVVQWGPCLAGSGDCGTKFNSGKGLKWSWLELGDQCWVGMEVEAGCSSSFR